MQTKQSGHGMSMGTARLFITAIYVQFRYVCSNLHESHVDCEKLQPTSVPAKYQGQIQMGPSW